MARPRLITDEQILAAMRRAVLAHGPHVSLDVVAGELKVTPPALLKRFGNRRTLLLEALRPPAEPPWVKELVAGPDERPLPAQLEQLFTRIWDMFVEVMPCIAALRESGIPPHELFEGSDEPPPLRFLKTLTRWLEKGRAQGRVAGESMDIAATAMLGALQTRAYTAHLMNQSFSTRSQRAYLRSLAQLFSRALEPAVPPARRTPSKPNPRGSS